MASLEVVPFSYENYAFDFTLPSQDIPESVVYPPFSPVEKIDHIEVFNFKSFSGLHFIGPFLSNTTIVGPNGSGKSNIVDAICFVFGISVSSLRSTHLSDLVNKTTITNKTIVGGGNKKQNKSSNEKHEVLTYVTLHLILNNGDSLELKRTIDNFNKSQVYINEEDFHWRHYAKYLLMCNIQMNPASFLILQSETYHIIEKTPKELLEFFEKICGSYENKEKYSELKNSLELLQNQIKDNTISLNSMKNERKKLRQQIQYSEEYKKLLDELETLENQHYGLNFFKYDSIISGKSLEFLDKSAALANFKESQEKERLDKQKKAVYFKKKRDEFRKLEEKFLKTKKDVSENRLELNKVSEEITYSTKILNAKDLSIKKIEEEFSIAKNTLEKMTKEEVELSEALHKCEKELEVDENNQEISGKYKKNFQEYLQFQKESEVKLQPLKLEIQKMRNHEKKLFEKIEETKKRIDNLETVLSQTSLKGKEISMNIQNAQNNFNEINDNQKELTNLYDNLKKKLNNNSEKKQKLLQLKEKKEILLAEAQYILSSMLDLKEKNELFYELRTIKGFREDISTLVSPLKPEFDLPLRIALGSALDYLVVDNAEVSKQINNILREKGLQRHILILENIPKLKRTLNASLIGNHGLLAENTLTFRREIHNLESAINYLLQGKIICENSKQAEAIKSNFIKKKAETPKEIITYDGLVLRQGVVSAFGNIERMKESGKKFSRLLDQKSMEIRKSKEEEIEKIKLELKRNDDEIKDFNTNQEEQEFRKLEVKMQENSNKLKVIETELKALSENKKTTDQQLKIHHENIKKVMVEKAKLEKELSSISNDIREHEKNFSKEQNDIYKPLLQKMKVNNVSEISGKDYEQLNKVYEKKLALTKSLESLRLEIKNNKAAILEKNLKNLKSSIETDSKNHEFLLNSFKNYEKKSIELSKDLENLKEELSKNQNKLNLEESEENQNFLKLQTLESELTQKERELKELEISIHQNLDRKLQLHEELKIKSINLPLLNRPSNYEAGFSQIEEKLFPSSSSTRAHNKNKIHINYDALNMKKLLKSLVSSNQMVNEDEEQGSGDDGESNHDFVRNISLGNIEKKLEEMDEEIKIKSEKIEEYNSNLMQSSYSNVFSEKLNKYETKIKEMIKEQEDLLEQEKEVAEDFESSKNERLEKFSHFFDEVKKTTDDIYKSLTKADKNYDVGGSALLYLENQNDPFNGGIIYSATPPNKRYVFDTEQLSGGEKTMGGLALLFALNLAAKNRFMIFDETDAYLDFENSQKFMEFTKELSQKADLQVIVVSHKKNIYENADSLIGVSYANRFNTSQAFSLDLRE